ncbi:monodehydroascorbate reductase, partial [Tanacetum coccineum]
YDYYESVGIFHQKTVPRTPQQNGVVERQNRTLVEAARTMLIFSKASMFLWAEAVATACYTQNRSLIHTRHDKTPYELTFFQVFGALCYPTNDSENLGKLQPRADIGIFIGYAPSRKGIVPNPAPATPYVPPTNKELEMLFQPMFDEYFNPPDIRQDPIPNVAQDPVIPTGPSVSISFDLDAPSGKTSGFERPRAPVLQILWGVVNRAHIDYAERMWEEFTQSIHTFTEDKRNLAQHTLRKKKATLILIPSIRFTKLIIFHLQRLHNFHPRPESPLHLPTEEPVLGNLKFTAKGIKREVFGMTILNELINDIIRGSDYYDAYLEKVAKHQRHLAGEEVSDPESPAPKPAKPTKQAKPKATKQPTVSKTTAKKPKPAPAKPKEKKRKPVSESLEAPPLAKRAKAGKVVKERTVKSSKLLVDEFIDEGVPAAKPRLEDTEEEIMQKAGSDPGKLDEGQAGPNPDDVAESQPLPTPSVLVGPNLEHSDIEITDASSQPQPDHMDEGFIATAYPEVQENFKLTVDE